MSPTCAVLCHQNVVESILNLARSEIRGQDLKIVFSVIFTGGYRWFKYFNSFLTQSAAEPRKPSLWGRRRGKLDVQSEVLTVLKAILFPHIVYGILYTVNFEKHFSNGDSKLLWTRTFNNGHFIFTCNVRQYSRFRIFQNSRSPKRDHPFCKPISRCTRCLMWYHLYNMMRYCK